MGNDTLLGTISDYQLVPLLRNGKPRNKVRFKVKLGTNTYFCSDVNLNIKGSSEIRALWYFLANGEIDFNSTLGRLLMFLDAKNPKECINKQIELLVDKKGFYILKI